jgi:hypothetical protein
MKNVFECAEVVRNYFLLRSPDSRWGNDEIRCLTDGSTIIEMATSHNVPFGYLFECELIDSVVVITLLDYNP